MAELLLPDGYAMVTLRWRLDGDNEEMMSTFAGRVSTDIEDDSSSNLAEGIYQAWMSFFTASAIRAGWNFVGVDVLKGPRDAGEFGQFEDLVAGGSSGAALPNNCAMLVRKVTGLTGRRHRGRMYIPPCYFSESDVDARGFIATTPLTGLQTGLTAFMTAVTSGGSHEAFEQLELLHTDNGGDPDLLAPTPVTGLAIQPQLATMRKRMRR